MSRDCMFVRSERKGSSPSAITAATRAPTTTTATAARNSCPMTSSSTRPKRQRRRVRNRASIPRRRSRTRPLPLPVVRTSLPLWQRPTASISARLQTSPLEVVAERCAAQEGVAVEARWPPAGLLPHRHQVGRATCFAVS